MKPIKTFRKERGQAGLDFFLAVVASLFMIGLIVMVFTLAGSEITSSIDSESISVNNETLSAMTSDGVEVDEAGRSGCRLVSVLATNSTGGEIIASGNYTTSACTISSNVPSQYNTSVWNVTYTAEYNSAAQETVNDSSDALAGTVDWFPVIIVLGAVIVLVLMVVLIIRAVRGTGLQGA